MKKIAIFVEGQTELIFVREYLLKQFKDQGIDVEIFSKM
jgi:predicted ATP-dependent endonuclease of OLD family